ncbi:MAG: hypothetical protein QG568_125 [Patescibacteria group bacterium]|nr:hypothetical protein [Patescibacteria group bacterium]
MKIHSTQIRVEAKHLDKGDHANWLAQLAMAQEVHLAFRNQLGIGLEVMKEKYKLFFVMQNVKDVFYRSQLRLGDVLDVRLTMWISRPTSLEFHCIFYKEDKIATEMSWVMPLVSVETQRLCRIPQWMINIIGTEKPN